MKRLLIAAAVGAFVPLIGGVAALPAMLFSAGGGDTNFPFCKSVNGSPVNSYDCGV